MEKKALKRLWRTFVLCAGVLYLLVVVGATVYSQTGYVQSLPVVELGQPEGGRVPASAAAEGEDGPILYCVDQQDGPWGKRYILRQVPAYSYWARDDGTILIYDAAGLEDPLVFSASIPLELAYDGMEVRLG